MISALESHLEEHESWAWAGGIDDGVEQRVGVQLVDLVHSENDQMQPLEVLHDAHGGPEKKGGNGFLEVVTRAVEDKVPGNQHHDNLVGVGQAGQGRFWRQNAAHDPSRIGVENGQDETWERALSGEVKGAAMMAVESGSKAQALENAVGDPKHWKYWESKQGLLQDQKSIQRSHFWTKFSQQISLFLSRSSNTR